MSFDSRDGLLGGLLSNGLDRVGEFWADGNPAELPDAIGDTRTVFGVGRTAWSGGYHPPLDPSTVTVLDVEGWGWRRLNDGAAAIGDIRLDQRSATGGTFATGIGAPGMSPLYDLDTTQSDLSQARATLRGAIGWRRGPVSAGLSGGYLVAESHAPASRLARSGSAADPAVVMGASWRLPVGGVAAGVYGRYLGHSETENVVTNPDLSGIYQMRGYDEPDLVLVLPSAPYYRRAQRDSRAVGATAHGEIFGTRWTAFAEQGWLGESHSSAQQQRPPEDIWKASGLTAGLAGERALFAGLVRLVGDVRWSGVTGSATRADIAGRIYMVHQTRLSITSAADLRLPDSTWQIRGRVVYVGGGALARDYLASLHTDVTTHSPGASVSLARQLDARNTVTLSIAAAQSATVAVLPFPDSLGPAYRAFVAPTLEWQATPALMRGAALMVVRKDGAAAFWTRVVVTEDASRALPSPSAFRPAGTRSVLSLSGGVSLVAPR